MNTCTQTDIWTYRIVVVLGLIVLTNAVGSIVLALMGRSMPELLIALGSVAAGGLGRLLIPLPLNRSLLE